jgi:hypothetical protein
VLPEYYLSIITAEDKNSLQAMLSIMSNKLVRAGKVQILTDVEKETILFRKLVLTANEAGLELSSSTDKKYFPNDWIDPEFKPNRIPQLVVFGLDGRMF